MASTYSALKIELITTGEQSGTWGTTTNNNLGDAALGEAITGSADVAFSSADVTVTLTDTNASQAARNLRLNLTGTSGGARNLVLGSGCQIEKLYLVNNTLADAVTVKNTSGSGIAVPAGKTMFVFNNGTNVVDATTALSSLNISGLTASKPVFTDANKNLVSTGTLAVDQGGTGQSSNLVAGGVLYGASTSAAAVTAAGTTGQALTSNGASAPSFGTLDIAGGGTGATTNVAYSVVVGGTTTGGAYQSVASVGTSGQVLTSGGAGVLPTWTTVSSKAFPTGTRMSFQQTAAPTGWTKDTTAGINDAMIRLVTGSASSGGTTAFSTWNGQTATGAFTLSTSEMPSHTHTYTANGSTNQGSPKGNTTYAGQSPGTATGATGGGGSHTHSLTQSLKYYDFIIASID